jgi:hypothetical protein
MKNKNIMDSILSGSGDEFIHNVNELDCMIYKKDNPKFYEDKPVDQDVRIWESSKKNVSVQVWEGKAKIKVKVSSMEKGDFSMKRIADIAVNAILKELKKED